MYIYRYIVLFSDKTETGIFTAGFDCSRIVKKYGVKDWDGAMELSKSHNGWLKAPGVKGEYWFTELGNEMFKRNSLEFIINRLPAEGSKAVCRKKVNLSEIPNWESILKYQDEFQVVF